MRHFMVVYENRVTCTKAQRVRPAWPQLWWLAVSCSIGVPLRSYSTGVAIGAVHRCEIANVHGMFELLDWHLRNMG